jgi:hypothetical protein
VVSLGTLAIGILRPKCLKNRPCLQAGECQIKYVFTHAEYDKETWKNDYTFDLKIYSGLLSQYQPRIIKTEEENEIFLEILEGLLSPQNLTLEEDALLELLLN